MENTSHTARSQRRWMSQGLHRGRVAADPGVAYAVAAIGGRESMEDEHVLELESSRPLKVLGAVFDGHGGVEVARLAKARFSALFRDALPAGPTESLRRAFAAIHREAQGLRGGAGGVGVFIDRFSLGGAEAGDGHAVGGVPGRAEPA